MRLEVVRSSAIAFRWLSATPRTACFPLSLRCLSPTPPTPCLPLATMPACSMGRVGVIALVATGVVGDRGILHSSFGFVGAMTIAAVSACSRSGCRDILPTAAGIGPGGRARHQEADDDRTSTTTSAAHVRTEPSQVRARRRPWAHGGAAALALPGPIAPGWALGGMLRKPQLCVTPPHVTILASCRNPASRVTHHTESDSWGASDSHPKQTVGPDDARSNVDASQLKSKAVRRQYRHLSACGRSVESGHMGYVEQIVRWRLPKTEDDKSCTRHDADGHRVDEHAGAQYVTTWPIGTVRRILSRPCFSQAARVTICCDH